MALTRSTYTQTESAKQFQDVTTSPATVADGTLRQRFDVLAFPQKGVKYAGRLGALVAAPVVTLGTVLTAGGTFAANTYFWVVTATSADRRGEGVVSNEITQVIAANIVPADGNGTVAMSWPAVANATGYRVYRGTATGAENKLVATTTALTFTDTGAAGTTATLPTADGSGVAVPAAATSV